jgi:hypothetical protein
VLYPQYVANHNTYNTTAFEFLLSKHNLLHLYPLLVTNLRNGFSLGDMHSLTKTIILWNHSSAIQYTKIVDEYLIDKVKAGCMSRPFLQYVNTLNVSFVAPSFHLHYSSLSKHNNLECPISFVYAGTY